MPHARQRLADEVRHPPVQPAAHSGSHAQILRLVLDNMAEGVCVADLDGRIITANPAAEAVFGPLHGVAFDERFGPGFRLDDQITPCPPALRPMTRAIRGDSIERQSLFIDRGQDPDSGQRRGAWIASTPARCWRPTGGSSAASWCSATSPTSRPPKTAWPIWPSSIC